MFSKFRCKSTKISPIICIKNKLSASSIVKNDADKPIVMQINGICLKLPNMVLNVHINIWQSKYCF